MTTEYKKHRGRLVIALTYYEQIKGKAERHIIMQKDTNIITWGDNHKFYTKDLEYAKLLAYHKAFYFSDTKLNGILIDRPL